MRPDEWPQGMENEADSVADHEWAHQTRLYRGQHRKVWIPMVGIVLASAVFLRLDWSPSDAANQLSMAWLLVCALALGASTRSRLSWLVAARPCQPHWCCGTSPSSGWDGHFPTTWNPLELRGP